jgi:cation:H+ antiporter
MMSDKHLARWEGAVLAVGILVYIIANVSLSRKAKCVKQFEEFEQEEIEQAKKGGLRVFFDIVLILLGIVALVLGADWLVDHGEQIATIFGVPDVVISLTLFALGTSLPELATAIVAALKRQGDISEARLWQSHRMA